MSKFIPVDFNDSLMELKLKIREKWKPGDLPDAEELYKLCKEHGFFYPRLRDNMIILQLIVMEESSRTRQLLFTFNSFDDFGEYEFKLSEIDYNGNKIKV